MNNKHFGKHSQWSRSAASVLCIVAAILLLTPLQSYAAGGSGSQSSACTPVSGMEFTWCVPVQVHKVSSHVTAVSVACTAFNAEQKILAQGTDTKPVPSGSHGYDGMLSPAADLGTLGSQQSDQTPFKWRCSLQLKCGSKNCGSDEGVKGIIGKSSNQGTYH